MLQKLYYHTVEQNTLGVLKSLFKLPELNETRLVGGTALALLFGHRTSIDIDLFGTVNFQELINNDAFRKVGSYSINKNSKSILSAHINQVKVDLVNYNYPWLENYMETEGLRLAGIKDIGAMKIAAITGRGTKKDFIDLHFLLQEFSIDELMSFYRQKYADGSEFLVLKSLVYFADAENQEPPTMFSKISWTKIKASVSAAVHQYINAKN